MFMRLLALALFCPTIAFAADVPVTIEASGEPCIDAPSGKPLQLECVEKYGGEVKPISARVCKLPDQTWILNFRWKCVDKVKK